MMKTKIGYILFFAMVIALSSCDKDYLEISPSDECDNEIAIVPAASLITTRTSFTDNATGIEVSWNKGDCIGLFVSAGGTAQAVNYPYSADSSSPSSSFTAVGSVAYWRNSVITHDIVAYYPYNATATDLTAVPISIPALQQQSASGNTTHLSATDFVYAMLDDVVMPADGKANLNFIHPLLTLELDLSATSFDVAPSKLIFRCTDASEIVSASGATINLTTGSIDYTNATTSNQITVEIALSLTSANTDKVYMQITPGHSGKRFKIIAVVDGKEIEIAEKGIPASGLPSGSNAVLSLNVPAKQNNGIWVKSADFAALGTSGFTALAGNGINAIFVNEAVITNGTMTAASFKASVDKAALAGIDVHMWMKCFNNGSWVNPINTTTETFNQDYFNQIITRASTYAGYGNLAGIHLDYIRYPGTANSYYYSQEINGQTAITEFCRQLSVAVKAIDPDLVISAALMNEKSSNATYYGQNARTMSQWVDVLIPMIYRYYYNSETKDHGADWISSTTKWFADEVAAAGYGGEVWAGIMTYKPLNAAESSIEKLTADQLKIDSGLSLLNSSSVATGATGVVLFRYGIVNYFDMKTLYE